jgi:ABC-2 type transport system ATP-binding protein
MAPIISINQLHKSYKTGLIALKNVSLDINRGEILALLGPNGAGKTTLINIVCGIVTKTSGSIAVDGHDTVTAYRQARAKIGLVPQELHLSIFETAWDTVSFSRALFGKPSNPDFIERVLKQLSLWDKKDQKIMALSGGMKRRVLIAKALAHEPEILFLDEPTAGVDVELRKEMWDVVRALRDAGTTVILTTHYIEEAEEMADRVAVINKGEIILVEDKNKLMKKLGQKRLVLHLDKAMKSMPKALARFNLELSKDGKELAYGYDTRDGKPDISILLKSLETAKVAYHDLDTEQRSLEDIFIGLVQS